MIGILLYYKYSYESHIFAMVLPLIIISINNIFKLYKDLKEYFTYL